MIYIIDDFLDKEILKIVTKDLKDFEEVDTGDKSFWVKNPSKEFIDYIVQRLELVENKSIKNILGFFREAKQGQDNKWRIHNDSIINNEQPDRAIVLYLSKNNDDFLNGTSFWEHKQYGDRYDNINPEEFNKLLKEDSEDLSKWKLKTVVDGKKNRLLSYPCNYFHSKYPNEFKKSRIVFVMFYKYEKV